jgi:hypothetical protein
MSSQPHPSRFYLPVVLPPTTSVDKIDISDYYLAIETLGVQVAVDPVAGDVSLEITISNSNLPHPSDPRLFSTVFAPTSGFVRFYPGKDTLPAPLAPLNPPSTLSTTDIGTIVIRVWIPDLMSLIETPADSPPRPNRITLGWLQTSTVKKLFETECQKQDLKILQKSWVDASGATPSPTDKTALAGAFLDRFMKGEVEIFVSAGAELGSAALATGTDAKLKLQAYSQLEGSAAPPPISVAADFVIDNAANEALFEGHPLIKASNAPIQITFKSSFTIWNNRTRQYETLADGINVSLMKAPGDILVPPKQTTRAGQFAVPLQPSPPLMKRDLIFFRYDTASIQVGDRTFDSTIDTDPHLARLYLDANGDNIRTYQASDRIYPAYQAFQDDLSKNADEEIYDLDRGNSSIDDNSTSGKLGSSNQLNSRLHQIQNSETNYHRATTPRFSVLFEGDSWLDYPVDDIDMFRRLDDWFRKTTAKNGVTYVAFPLQYHGDRSDQMFVGDAADANRQWHFTSEFLREYKIDLIVCSAGGNDFAEPGISHWQKTKPVMENPTAKPYVRCIQGDFVRSGNTCYFDPTLMSENLMADQQAVALGLIDKSFAILLNNHPWHLYDRTDGTMGSQQDEFSLYVDLDQLLDIAVDANGKVKDFGERDPTRQNLNDTGNIVIQNFNLDHLSDLPDPTSQDWRHKILTTVFDSVKYRARFDATLNNWRILLTAAETKGIPVIAHSYCYPVFSQKNTTGPIASSKAYNGPWFAPRFYQANILDLRIRCICLKTMIDNFRGYVLDTLKAEFPGTFDYVDFVKLGLCQDASFWADEMHLTSPGFKILADALYKRIAGMNQFKSVFK